MYFSILLLAFVTTACEAQLNFMSFLDPDKMGRMVQLAQDLTRAAAGGVVDNERESLQRASQSVSEPMNLNAPPSELFAQGFQNIMLPARQGFLNALTGQSLLTTTTTTTPIPTTTYKPLIFNTPKKPNKGPPKARLGANKKVKIPKSPLKKKPRAADYDSEDYSGSNYSSGSFDEEEESAEDIPPRPNNKPKWGAKLKKKPRARAAPLKRIFQMTTTTTAQTPIAPQPSIDSQPETIDQNPFLRLARTFLRGATGSATDNSDSGVELRPTFKSPPRAEVSRPQTDLSGLQAVARAFMGSPNSDSSYSSGGNPFETSGIPRSAPTSGSQKELGVIDFNNMARLARAFMGGSSSSQPTYSAGQSLAASQPLSLSAPAQSSSPFAPGFSSNSAPSGALVNSGGFGSQARALGVPSSDVQPVSPGAANMQSLGRLAEAFFGSGGSSSKASSLAEVPRAQGTATLSENPLQPSPQVQQQALEGLKTVAEAFMGGARSAASESGGPSSAGRQEYSLPTIKDFLPGAGNNFGLRRGEGCLPFLSEAMQLMYGNCQKEADQKAFDTWGNEIKNALLEGRMDLLRASKETCKRTAERQQCAALREAIATCDIMGSLKIGSQLQREVKRCDEVTGIIDQNPMAVIGQVSQLMTGEVAQGFFSNFLKG